MLITPYTRIAVRFSLYSLAILVVLNILHCVPVFIKFVHLLPLVIQINTTYAYNSLYQNCSPIFIILSAILVVLNILHCVPVFIKFICLLPLVIQINATYIYNSLQCDLPELHL